MHNPTRRVKRFKRPLSLTTRPPTRRLIPQTDDATTRFCLDVDVDSAASNDSSTRARSYGDYDFDHHGPYDHFPGRHRPLAAQPRPRPDVLLVVRGAVLVALVIVTLVLYTLLWELQRVQMATVVPITKPANADGRAAVLVDAGMASPAVVQDGVLNMKQWPPPITRVPEDEDTNEGHGHDERPNENDSEKAAQDAVDAGFCHGPCRFLLPVRIGEQESKARMHFVQLLELARRLGRTIVLPRVGKSRMSACAKWPFDAYYDTHAWCREHEGAPDHDLPSTMDLERFAAWVDARPVPPSSFVVAMTSVRRGGPGTRAAPEEDPLVVDTSEVDPKTSSCLKSRLARLHSSLPGMALSVAVRSGLETGPDAATRLVQLLSSPLDVDVDLDSEWDWSMDPGYDYAPRYLNDSFSLAGVGVLVLDYDLRHPLFTDAAIPPSFHLHYAPAFYDLADHLAENLGPFLGVHWRMETVPVQHLAWCAAALVSTLEGLLQNDVTGKDVRHVWLATDHPRPLGAFQSVVDGMGSPDDPWALARADGPYASEGPSRKSSTFAALSAEHDDAIATLVEAFMPGGELDAWMLTDLSEQLRRYPYVEGRFDVNDTLLDDSGVFGILDKLVIVQANVFVSGSTECGKTSSFSKQVIEARQESFEAERGKGAVRNVVDYFGQE